MSKHDKKLDQAARAAWMYYVAGQTQHQIAEALGVSRQVAQRLVACAIDNGLISVSIAHPVGRCMELAAQLSARYGLELCQVVPSQGMDTQGINRAVAVAGAEVMAQFIRSEEPLIVGVGSGRSLKAAIDELAEIQRPQHSCVSLIGAIAADGSCTRYDVPLWMAEKTQGRYFILPAPLFADSEQDRALWCNHRIYRTVSEKASQADVTFIGVGTIGEQCPLHQDGFISLADVARLTAANAVAEMLGHFIDGEGRRVINDLDRRLTSVELRQQPEKPVIALAGGPEKHRAIRAALAGRWINGLVTDEGSALALLAD
ncbi:Transcriptional regulator lsrR [Serratia entomophila]|uniref:Sugar-binding transcriptional regulator n=1 Tax=Serratia entomophila TaxID=42906 RepID=A0ABY5CKS6_9GAMM|nr:sugar-binding transcriptional regulator [Serratia entomophila]UIW16312.1 sugar-binding transcriptional regulator [Serratia entomophila]USU98870.1 sugar-binding transcriptional regulator [Serratia entomophila]CAI0702485.1 Transcriptional regulator lsrR [Serratia entomophila]CAI0792349.1 Transcriptional regulator lsrR [Serratia entomophila]CAI0862692.1 Transcriptional regulator lsrR [Serratia entomophila]